MVVNSPQPYQRHLALDIPRCDCISQPFIWKAEEVHVHSGYKKCSLHMQSNTSSITT